LFELRTLTIEVGNGFELLNEFFILSCITIQWFEAVNNLEKNNKNNNFKIKNKNA